jgi:hypothetical protein
MNEANTCRRLVRPKLEEAGWDDLPHAYSEQTSFADGRIIVPGGNPRRLKKKFTDFLLRYTRDITLAVIVFEKLKERSIDFSEFASSAGLPKADALRLALPLGLQCYPSDAPGEGRDRPK